MLQHLKEKKDVGFFTSVAGLMQQCWYERLTKIVVVAVVVVVVVVVVIIIIIIIIIMVMVTITIMIMITITIMVIIMRAFILRIINNPLLPLL